NALAQCATAFYFDAGSAAGLFQLSPGGPCQASTDIRTQNWKGDARDVRRIASKKAITDSGSLGLELCGKALRHASPANRRRISQRMLRGVEWLVRRRCPRGIWRKPTASCHRHALSHSVKQEQRACRCGRSKQR